MNFDDIWQGVAVAVVLAAAAISGKALVSEHRVDGYYLSHTSASQSATCIVAHWTWHPDEIAFCTNSPQEALEVLERANATVRK